MGSLDKNANPSATPVHPWWLWPNLLSLDAPLVALVWLWTFASEAGFVIGWPIYTILGLAVWIIYVIDRLCDALRYPVLAQAPARHRFYDRHARHFRALVGVAFLVASTLTILYGDGELIRQGVTVGVLAAAYLAVFARSRTIPKELSCGLIFAAGTVCALPFSVWLTFAGEIAAFAILCAGNCVVIARAESDADAINDPAALPQRSPWATRAVLILLLCLVPASIFLGASPLSISIGLSAAALLILDRWSASPVATRVLADAVLLSPMLLLVISWLF